MVYKLIIKSKFYKWLAWPDRVLAQALIKFIKFYQLTFSPDHSPFGKRYPHVGCKFYPTCSQYGVQALQKHGFLLGVPRVLWRVLRCHPWSKGGVDLGS